MGTLFLFMSDLNAVICANGLGDGLLMMILVQALQKQGKSVTVYHDKYLLLQEIFPETSWEPVPKIDDLKTTLQDYRCIFVENDNSSLAWKLLTLRQQKKLLNLCFIFPKTNPKGAFPGDYIFNPKHSFAMNLSLISQKILNLAYFSKDNGFFLTGVEGFRKNKTRIIIHPTSQDPKRNWKKSKFLTVAARLKKLGYDPVFIVAPHEYEEWKDVKSSYDFQLKTFSSLKELSLFIHESGFFIGNDSGLGHIASNCALPTLTISGNNKRVKTWRPDFALNILATPFFTLPNFKGINFLFREKFWQYFVSTRKVLKRFHSLKKSYEKAHL